MKINPAQYQCPQHHADLTDLVQEELDAEITSVAYKRGLLLGRKPPEPKSLLENRAEARRS
jgi:hypothetical protein